MVSIRYFAWLREAVGTADEKVELPPAVKTGTDLIGFLKSRHPHAAEALGNPKLKMAVDLELTPLAADVSDAGEIAFFPPMTGG